MQSRHEPRELVHLQVQAFADDGVLERMLQAAGWRFARGDGAGPETSADEPGVGLLDLRGVGPDRAPALLLPAMAAVLSAPRREWVAVLHAAQLDCVPLGRLVHGYCRDYVTVPCEADTLSLVLGHALGMARLPDLDEDLPGDGPRLEGVIGESEVMRQLARRVLKAAGCDAPVFLSGETGTGKELVAAALHRHSRRKSLPFVGINCGAIPHSLMESELFGYERGAFTGAVQRKLGRVELAHGGTLFLDEVADLPMESQASLLRFLEEGRICRLGGQAPIRVDARIVSATHVDLRRAVDEGRFRADLYHRLRVIELKMPALRERGGDLVLIAQHALQRHAGEAGGRVRGFKACALRAIQSYGWPGNVRELINRVREAMVMAEGCHLSARDLQLEDRSPDQQAVTIDLARRAGERTAIDRALARHGQHVGQAADELGISRVTLYRLMLRHGLHEARPDAQWSRLSLVKGGGEEA
ncbi:sigma-54 dependent transcriptional regulator [Luteimonas kalidii]|uniref:Sigma-54 dependent transcriptional regulator n=1 Tax=Luteimonas kalidii TaxID=3042025 RepID=A0ABT6JR42_9GAMM|nr:sigma-54 dependent transcriptional regulator [Luteimonas kalidii]MDH5832446.1 sigma-54 dependent transcriptional regulator [Luteimonas kalidii]